MNLRKASFGIVGLAGCLIAGISVPANAQSTKPTVESAHAFLAEMLNRKSTMHGYYCRVVSYTGTQCTSELTAHCDTWPNNKHVVQTQTFTMDWSKMTGAKAFNNGVIVELTGAIKWRSLTTKEEYLHQFIQLKSDAVPTAERMAKAFDFLRTHCDKSGRFGF